ncbi:MAG: class II aldolase/adducin family protein [Actinobacteria bacterium]|nr:class II aldolase/adducin family protein [Actinomycetota bacterium]
MSGADSYPIERQELVSAARALVERGLVSGTAGNASVRIPAGRLITPAGADLGRLRPADLVVAPATEAAPGGVQPSSELPLHLAIGEPAIVHTHSHFATVLSCFGEEVPAVHYLMARLGGPIRVAPYATTGTDALAAAAVEGLRERAAVLLANHGAVVVADTLAEATDRASLLEESCAIAYHARLLGGPRTLSIEELAQVSESQERNGKKEVQASP